MSSWFKKYDLLTLKSQSFLSDIAKILAELPNFPLETIDSPLEDPRNQPIDSKIMLSTVDFENILQKSLIKILNLLMNFFKSEYFVIESGEAQEFCRKSFSFLSVEKRYFLNLWTKQNAMHANFIMNRILSSFVRFLFFFQSLHRFILSDDENRNFIESDPADLPLNFENVYAMIDCITLVFTSLLQKLSHLKDFLQNELYFLLRIYLFLSNFKTFNIQKNIQQSRIKFPEKDLENMVYLILDTSKTAVIINKSLLSSTKVYELEPEYEEDKSLNTYTKGSYYEEKESVTSPGIREREEIPLEKSPMLLSDFVGGDLNLTKQRSMKQSTKLKITKNQSIFFEELNENAEQKKEEVETLPVLTVKKPPRIRKSLLGDTRNSLIAEFIATASLPIAEDQTAKKPANLSELQQESTPSPSKATDFPIILESQIQPRSGIVRNLEGEGTSVSFWKYMNTINPTVSILSTSKNDKDSVMNSHIFKNSQNLPMNSVLSTVHPSICYYKPGINKVLLEEEKNKKIMELGHLDSSLVNSNLVKSMSSRKYLNIYEDSLGEEPEERANKQKFEAINKNLNEGLVKYLMEFGRPQEKTEKDEKDAKGIKGRKDAKEKKMNLFIKDLEGDNLMTMVTRGDEESPKNNGRRTLSGKKEKELKKQLTQEREEEINSAGGKGKRKSNKSNTKKLGITEKDLIKIDKNTEIKEKLIYSSFQEKSEDNVPRDEDIIITSLSSETDDLKKRTSIPGNSFMKSVLMNDGLPNGVAYSTMTSYYKEKEKEEKIQEIRKPHYKLSTGMVIPFFVKKEDEEEMREFDMTKFSSIVEEAYDEANLYEDFNGFSVVKKKGKSPLKN